MYLNDVEIRPKLPKTSFDKRRGVLFCNVGHKFILPILFKYVRHMGLFKILAVLIIMQTIERSFNYAAPCEWNKLSEHIRTSNF